MKPNKYTNNLFRFTVEIVDTWAKMYEAGSSSTDIASEYGTSPSHVRERLRKAGVAIRTRGEVKLAERNPNWVGDDVKYFPLHQWVKYRLPKPSLCQNCQAVPPYDLANIDNQYNRDLSNWKWLCRRCHMIEDGRLDRFIEKTRQRRAMAKNKKSMDSEQSSKP